MESGFVVRGGESKEKRHHVSEFNIYTPVHFKVSHEAHIEVSVQPTSQREGLQYKHPCLARDSNPDPTAPQSASLDRMRDYGLFSVKEVLTFTIGVRIELKRKSIETFGKGVPATSIYVTV
ncbi:hypothetical protein TNCV_4414401 [Trichonephila clavipes]|uniref:Uncharacterized protein n=1 Tax=Trichonephila clavipes TaxID=2585209 RepID=A0A8X6RYQ1_TRICX|nr:hypothetical protein TNCV_4414401 [Trichonephila clavipes]